MISQQQLESVSQWLGQQGQSANLQNDLRAAFSDLHFTFCSDDDIMLDTPIVQSGGFNLYLVDSSSHCLALTTDLASASGLVVAEVEEA